MTHPRFGLPRQSVWLVSLMLTNCFPIVPLWGQVQIVEPRPNEPRSVFSRNDRPADELDRPRVTERHSHRGWEVRTNRGVVIANTSVEDARMVSAIVHESWQTMDRFADNFTEIHRHPDFGLSAVQVFIDQERPKERDLPVPVFTPGAFESRITLNVSEDRPSLAKQIPILRAAVAYSYLHVSQLDKLLPEWVSDGFAQATVLRHEGMEGLDALAKVPAELVRGDQWKRLRAGPDRLENKAEKSPQATVPEMVSYSLFGNDAVQAPQFFQVLAKSLEARQNEAPVANQLVRDRRLIVDQRPTAIDELARQWNPEFEAWTKDPDALVPQFASTGSDDPAVLRQERELFVVLKLAQRLFASKAEGGTTKVVEFKVQEARRERTRVRPIVPAANEEEAERPAPPAPAIDPILKEKQAKVAGVNTITDLLEELSTRNENRPWASIDADGSLLVSQNRRRLQQLLGDGEHYRATWEKDRWVWSTTLDDGRRLVGWLEPLKKDEPYLVARFAIRGAR